MKSTMPQNAGLIGRIRWTAVGESESDRRTTIRASASFVVFVIDVFIINTSFLVAFVHYNGFTQLPIKALFIPLLTALVWYVIALNSTVSTIWAGSKLASLLKGLFAGYSVLTAVVVFSVAAFDDFAPNNKVILWALFFATLGSGAVRVSYLIMLRFLLPRHYKRVLLIGGDRVAEKVLQKILTNPSLGYTLHGVLADYYHPTLPQEPYLGRLERFEEVVRSAHVDEAIIALPFRKEKEIAQMVERCEKEGIRVRLVPDFFRFVRNGAILERLGDIPLIGTRTVPLDLLKNRFLKRIFDISVSLTFLVVAFPVLCAIALLIKLRSPGPVFFKQERVGANNVKFIMYKFRTMEVQERKDSDTLWTIPGDPRVTALGRFLRKWNLDELPQFVNVLVGDMSIVGPRPEREYFVEQFQKHIVNYKVRHLVKSGITGLAQVNGFRGDTSIDSRVECDIHYLENWSFWLDLKIISSTIFARRSYENAY